MGFINLHFDDSYDTHSSFVAPLLMSKGITGTFAMIPGIHTSSLAVPTARLNVQRAREIQDVYGHECITHACTNVDHDNASLFTAADNYLAGESSFLKAKRLMTAQGLTASNSHELFAAPPAAPAYGDPTLGLGANTAFARHFICRRIYGGGFPSATAASHVETVRVQNEFHIRTIGYNGSTTTQAKDFISRCRLNPFAAGIIVFHDVTVAGSSGINISQTDLTTIVNEIVFQRDNNYQSDLASNTAAGKLKTCTFGQIVRRQLTPA